MRSRSSRSGGSVRGSGGGSGSGADARSADQSTNSRSEDEITRMLIVVVLVFVFCQSPAATKRGCTRAPSGECGGTIRAPRRPRRRRRCGLSAMVFCQSPAFITQALPTVLPETALPVCPYSYFVSSVPATGGRMGVQVCWQRMVM